MERTHTSLAYLPCLCVSTGAYTVSLIWSGIVVEVVTGPARFATPHLTVVRFVNMLCWTFLMSIIMISHTTGISAVSHGKALVTRNENLSGQRNSCHVGGSTSAVTAEGIMEDMGYHDLGSIRRSGLRLYECACQSGSIKALFRH